MVLGPQQSLLRLPGVAIWEIFVILGGLVTYCSYQGEPTAKLKSYRHLCTYPRKVVSAWTEDWSIPRPSTASITAPGGRDLGDFCDSGRAGGR